MRRGAPANKGAAPRLMFCLRIVAVLLATYYIGVFIYAARVGSLGAGATSWISAEFENMTHGQSAKAFNKKLKGTWQTIPDGQEPSREFQAFLYKDRFLLISDIASEAQAASLGLAGKRLSQDHAYKVRAIPDGNTLEIGRMNTPVTLNIRPCREVVAGHAFDDCMTEMSSGAVVEVAYRSRDSTESDLSALKAGVARVLQKIERSGEERALDH